MNETSVSAQLEALIPKNLDDIIRKNREKCSLHLSSRDDIAALAKIIVAGQQDIKDEIENWRIVCLDVEKSVGDRALVLIGDALRAKQVWNTSPLVGIDLASRIVLTRSGTLYRLAGPEGAGEPPTEHLLHVCVMLHAWGSGPYLGVPHIFY